jgi:hypothetical protein
VTWVLCERLRHGGTLRERGFRILDYLLSDDLGRRQRTRGGELPPLSGAPLSRLLLCESQLAANDPLRAERL